MPVVRVWCGDCSEFMENVGPVVTGRDRGSQRSAAAAKTKKLAQQLVSKTSTAVGPQPAGEKHLLPFIDAFFAARCHASAVYNVVVCPTVCDKLVLYRGGLQRLHSADNVTTE